MHYEIIDDPDNECEGCCFTMGTEICKNSGSCVNITFKEIETEIPILIPDLIDMTDYTKTEEKDYYRL